MKNHRLTLLALLLVCGTACQQKEILPEEPLLPEPEQQVVITASFANPTTRISYTEDEETHKLHQEWEEGDMLFGFDDNYTPLTLQVIDVDSQTGVATLEPVDCSLPASGSIHMLYTGDRDGRNIGFENGLPYTVNLCYQAVATSTTVPAVLTADAAVSNAEVHLIFENQTAILGIKGFHGLPANEVVESFFVDGVNNYAFFVLVDGKLTLIPGENPLLSEAVYVYREDDWVTDENGAVDETFYVAVLPNEQDSEIQLRAYDSQDTEYINSLGSKTIAAGKYYYMKNKELAATATYIYFSSGEQATTSSIEEAFERASAAAENCVIYLDANCSASSDLSITPPATRASGVRSDTNPEFWVTLDLDGYTLNMNGHSICVDAAGVSLSITNTYGTGILQQDAAVPVLKVSDGSLVVEYENEKDSYNPFYNPVIKCTSNATGYSPIVVTGGQLSLDGGYYFFNTTARLINSTDASYASVSKECRFNNNPGFTASSCTLDYDHMIGKAKPVTVDGITYHYRYVDKHAAYDNNDQRFKHFTINSDGDAVYLSRFNLNWNGQFLDSAWDYTPDVTCLMNHDKYSMWAENGYPSLSQDEWYYLLFTRAASTINGIENARFVKCTFQDKRGLLIFPDEFTWPDGAGAAPAAAAINNATANYDVVIYRAYANTLIFRGCVFLQADGYLQGEELKNANVAGNYWTSSTYPYSTSNSYALDFGSYRSGNSASSELKLTSFPNSETISVRPYFK